MHMYLKKKERMRDVQAGKEITFRFTVLLHSSHFFFSSVLIYYTYIGDAYVYTYVYV